MEDIVLFDMDGTLCDFNSGIFESLESIRNPFEEIFYPPIKDDAPDYIKKRVGLFLSNEFWWANLPKLKLGWEVLEKVLPCFLNLPKQWHFRKLREVSDLLDC